MLAICATAVFAICYQYLNLQSDIKTNSTAVVELQNQLNSLKAENNSHESEINAGIDFGGKNNLIPRYERNISKTSNKSGVYRYRQ